MTGRTKLGLYFILFYIAWTLKELSFAHFPDAILWSLVIKLLVWIVPVFCYLRYVDQHREPLKYLKLNQNVIQGIIWGIGISALLGITALFIIYVSHGEHHFDLGWRWITTLLFALPEELVFRGFLLQKLSATLNFAKANAYSSCLFASIHFPLWLINGTTIPKLILSTAIVFVVGLGLGYLFKRTSSLYCSAIVHSTYNLLHYISM